MALIVEGLSHRFGSQHALSDVSLRVEPGDCYGFIGHNGAGKTTAMRVMLGLLRPDKGRVIVDGFDAARHVREARARMGGLIETPGFHGHWSGKRNLRLLDRLAGTSSDIDGLLDLVGLGGAGKKPVRAYSQGMRQRLGVAQALLGDPAYILLDEPTNGLDPDGIRDMRDLILRLTGEQERTVLLSSHQLHELSGVCNRVGLLRQGKLVLEGALEDMLRSGQYLLETPDEKRLVELEGREPQDVLRGLVAQDVDVVSFAPQALTLEEIYHRDLEPPAPAPPQEARPPLQRRAPGNALPRMLMHESRRWLGQWTAPLMLLLPTIAGVVAMLLRGSDTLRHEQEVLAGGLFSTTTVNAYEGVATSLRVGVWLLCYVIAAFASQSVAAEYSQGTLRNVLLRPLTRMHVLFGKALAVVCAAICAYVILATASSAVAAWAFDFTGVIEVLPNGKQYSSVPEEEIAKDFGEALRSPLLPVAMYACIGFLAGVLLRRGAAALGAAVGFCLLLEMGRGLFPAQQAWFPGAYVPSFPTTSVPSFGDSSFVAHFLQISQGFANTSYVLAESDVFVPLIWIASTLLLSGLVFSRRYVP